MTTESFTRVVATGSIGPLGPQGERGPAGPVGMVWQGVWDSSVAYVVNDAVEFNGTSYISILDGKNQQPDTSPLYWSIIASKGDEGSAGLLDSLDDVDTVTSPPTDNADGLFWDTVSDLWIPKRSVLNSDSRLSDARTPVAHSHTETDVTSLTIDLAAKAASVHSHAESDVTSLTTDLAGKADTSHTHTESNVTGLTTDLASKASSVHTHAEADVTSLATDLAARSDGGLFKIARVALGASQASIDFSSIPSTFQHLRLVASLRSDDAFAFDNGILSVNNDTTDAHYYLERQPVSGTANQVPVQVLAAANSRLCYLPNGGTAPAGFFASIEINIFNYVDTDKIKIITVRSSFMTSISSGGIGYWDAVVGWNSTAVINRLTLTCSSNYVSGCKADLYGIKAAV